MTNCNCGTKPCGQNRCCGSCPEKGGCEVACKKCVPQTTTPEKETKKNA